MTDKIILRNAVKRKKNHIYYIDVEGNIVEVRLVLTMWERFIVFLSQIVT